PAYRLKQVIEESCQSDLTSHFDQVDCETQLKQGPVRQNIGRCSRGVAVYNKPAANEHLGEYSCQYGQEKKDTGDPRLEAGRCFCKPFRRSRIFCMLLWAAWLDPSPSLSCHLFPQRLLCFDRTRSISALWY